jgi:hypothetical protein
MKLSLVAIIIALGMLFTANAQKQNAVVPVSLPVDSITKLITYEDVIAVPGIKADTLYKKVKSWFNSFYKNPSEVIRENDSLKFKIVGKPRFKIYNPADKEGTKTDAGLIQYTITVAAKDGRFKYEITEFNWKQQSYYPAERWMDTKSQMYSSAYPEYLKQLDQYVKELIRDLKDAITHEKPVKNKNNW